MPTSCPILRSTPPWDTIKGIEAGGFRVPFMERRGQQVVPHLTIVVFILDWALRPRFTPSSTLSTEWTSWGRRQSG